MLLDCEEASCFAAKAWFPGLYGCATISQMCMISSVAATKLQLPGKETMPKGDSPESPESPESSESTEPLARITVSLPRSLCRQFRLHALDQDTTLSALVARLIRQELRDAG
jgi:hypothetical protein